MFRPKQSYVRLRVNILGQGNSDPSYQRECITDREYICHRISQRCTSQGLSSQCAYASQNGLRLNLESLPGVVKKQRRAIMLANFRELHEPSMVLRL